MVASHRGEFREEIPTKAGLARSGYLNVYMTDNEDDSGFFFIYTFTKYQLST